VIANKEVEHLENSSIKLTITIGKDEIKKEYDNLIKEYSKSIQIKGFRKGKVPANVLERKFGDSLRAETGQKLIENSLEEAIKDVEEKPLPYEMPKLEEGGEVELDKDFTFVITYDTFPKVKLGKYTGLEIEVPQVSITKEDEKRELEAIRDQNALVIEKNEGKAEKGDIVTIDYWEIDDEGNPKEETKREDFVFTLGSGYNLHKIDDDVIGMEKEDEKTVTKEYGEDFEVKELAGRNVKLGVKLKTIKERKLPDLDDDLAQDVSEKYETLDDLKKDLRKRLEDSLEAKLREAKVNALMEKVAADSEVSPPEAMIKADMRARWRQFASQFQADEKQVAQMFESQGKSVDELMESWRPNVLDNLKKRLAIQQMIEEEKIEVSEEEIEEEFKKQAESNSMDVEEIKEYYKQNNMIHYMEHELQERKLFDKVLEETAVKKGKKEKFLDFIGGNK
jgi:trigger factor